MADRRDSFGIEKTLKCSGALFLLLINGLTIEPAWANKTDDAFNTGLSLYYHRDYRGAIKYFDKCISGNNKFAQAYCERGNANYLLGNLSSALADLNTAIAIDPKLMAAYQHRARTLSELGQPKRAIDDCSKSISLDSKAADNYFLRGRLYCADGQITEGIADLTKAIGLQPKNSDYYFERATIYVALRQYKKAIQDYTVVISNHSSHGLERAYADRAQCYDKTGRHDLALKDRQKLNQETEESWGSIK